MGQISVMLADDHTLMRQGLRALLASEEDIVVVGEAESGEALLERVEDGIVPDVVLVDIQMPGISGIEATRRLKKRYPDVQVIALTAVEDAAIAADMLSIGAADYVLKSAAASDLVNSVRAAHAGQQVLSAVRQPQKRRTTAGRSALRVKRRGVSDPMALTQREMEIMRVLARGRTNKEIAEELIISERTVQTHLSSIFAKLQVKSRTEAVLVAVQAGMPG